MITKTIGEVAMKKVSVLDKLYYTIQALLLGVISMYLTVLTYPIFGSMLQSASLYNLGVFIAVFLSQIIVPAAAQIFLMRHKPSDYYELSDDKLLWLRKGVSNILPGEIIKLVLCILPFPALIFGRTFSYAGFATFFSTYCEWFNRYDSVVQGMTGSKKWLSTLYAIAYDHIVFGDFVGYIISHAVAVLPYIALVLFGYWYLWNKRGKELAEMKRVKSYNSEEV